MSQYDKYEMDMRMSEIPKHNVKQKWKTDLSQIPHLLQVTFVKDTRIFVWK